MPELISSPPVSAVEPVTEILHGIAVTDPYRWLEEQNSPRTRRWIEEQRSYARSFLDHFPGRGRIRQRIREFLAVETYDSLQRNGHRYFFRKRLAHQEQPCIYMREGVDGEDQLLVDPAEHGATKYTAVKPLRVSPDGRLLLFEVKEGGERTGRFKLMEIDERRVLPEVLPRGYLRGFAFAPDGKSLCYVHEPLERKEPDCRVAYRHVLGGGFQQDMGIFFAGHGEKLRLYLVSDSTRIGFLVYRFLEKTFTDFYIKSWDEGAALEQIVRDADYGFGPLFLGGRILALTNRVAVNGQIVEIRPKSGQEWEWVVLVAETDSRIEQWAATAERLVVSTIRGTAQQVSIFDLDGNKTGDLPLRPGETMRFLGTSPQNEELFLESESFTEPIAIQVYSLREGKCLTWVKKAIPFDSKNYEHTEVRYTSKDGTEIPMFLLARRDVLSGGCHPAILTSYGGYGVSMTPQFSVFVAFLIERGCLFALPTIRGGSEFGAEWHKAAQRRCRQTAYDDFLSAAEWLIETGKTAREKLAIFGGSNSGLLVAAAMTQRPELFRAVVCMVPILDMLRYHLFDGTELWREEFGTAEDANDFEALLRYSPYHQVRNGVRYPATMIVSGDSDRNCNPLHARKMTARLQVANSSEHPIILDYSPFRGHSPVLPLSERMEALTDRMVFLCEQLQLPV